MAKELAPIVLFVYNRPWHTKQTVEALQKNDLADQSELFIYADGAKISSDSKVQAVRDYIKNINGFKKVTIIEREKNWGLADNIVDGVTSVVNQYGKIIVLEDDIVTSTGFLKYMNGALNLYQNEDTVMHVSSFLPRSKFHFLLPNTFFLTFMNCWGWATWSNSWKKLEVDSTLLWNKIQELKILHKFNLDGSISFHDQLLGNINGTMKTWAIKWFTTIFLEGGLCLYSKNAMSRNIGQDGSGVNYNKIEDNDKDYAILKNKSVPLNRLGKLQESKIGRWYLKRYYFSKRNNPNLFKRLYYFLYDIYARR